MGKIDDLIDEVVQELLAEHKGEIAQTLRDLADEIEGETTRKRGPKPGNKKKGKKKTTQTEAEKKRKLAEYQRERYARLKKERAAEDAPDVSPVDNKKCPSCDRPKSVRDDYCMKCSDLL